VEAGIDIRGEVGTGHIAYMDISAGIRPGNGYENISVHHALQ
jgi:hypothetical protein